MNRKIIMALHFINGLFIILWPNFLMGTCVHKDGSLATCNYAARAEIIIGIIIIMNIIFNIRNLSLRTMNFMHIVCNGLAIGIPGFLIGTCKINMMKCNKVTFPILDMICLVNIIFCIVALGVERKKNASK